MELPSRPLLTNKSRRSPLAGTVSLGDTLGAVVEDTFVTNPTSSLLDISDLDAARAQETITGRREEAGPATVTQLNKPVLSIQDQEARLKELNLDGQIDPYEGETEEGFDLRVRWRQDELKRQAVLANSADGIGTTLASFAAGLGASIFDPINIASGFVPIMGPARYAKAIANAGSRAGRFAVRARVGAAEGLLGSALVEPIVLAGADTRQADYGLYDSVANLVFGTILGGGLHSGGGFLADTVQGRKFSAKLDSVSPEVRSKANAAGVAAVLDGRKPTVMEPIVNASTRAETQTFTAETTQKVLELKNEQADLKVELEALQAAPETTVQVATESAAPSPAEFAPEETARIAEIQQSLESGTDAETGTRVTKKAEKKLRKELETLEAKVQEKAARAGTREDAPAQQADTAQSPDAARIEEIKARLATIEDEIAGAEASIPEDVAPVNLEAEARRALDPSNRIFADTEAALSEQTIRPVANDDIQSLRAEIDTILEDVARVSPGEKPKKQSAKSRKVANDIERQLVEAGRDADMAKGEAAIHGAYAHVLETEYGIDPEAVYDGLTVERGGQAKAGSLSQVGRAESAGTVANARSPNPTKRALQGISDSPSSIQPNPPANNDTDTTDSASGYNEQMMRSRFVAPTIDTASQVSDPDIIKILEDDGFRSNGWLRDDNSLSRGGKKFAQGVVDAAYKEKQDAAEKALLREIKQDRGDLLNGIHKNRDLTFQSIDVSSVRNGITVPLHKSPSRNKEQSSEYRLGMVDGKPAYIRISNHWGTFYSNIKSGAPDAPKDVTPDHFGRVGSRVHNWSLEGGQKRKSDGKYANVSQAGYILLEDFPSAEAKYQKTPFDTEAQGTTPYTGDTITVDGVERGVTNSSGQRIAQTQEGLENFWRWFGDSKAVDAEGKPLVVYHGTPDTRAILKYGFREGHDGGIFFTSNKGVAETYADDSRAFDYQNAEPYNLAVYLSLKNPKTINAEGAHWRDTSAQVEAAKEDGFDSIIIRDTIDEYNSMMGEGGRASDVYAAFSPNLVKSAMQGRGVSRVDGADLGEIGNRGTFDPNDVRILYQSQVERDTRAFSAEIESFVRGEIKTSRMLRVGGTPEILQLAGMPEKPLRMSQSVARKVLASASKESKHAVRPETLSDLPRLLADPLAILHSRTRGDSLVAVLNATDLDGNQIMVSIVDGGDVRTINDVSSMYGKRNQSLINMFSDKGGVIYADMERASAAFRQQGVQFPKQEDLTGSSPNMLTKPDLVNTVRFKQGAEDARGRITFGDEATTIQLFEKADASTFLHESAHFFFEGMAKAAGTVEAPARLMQDYATLRNFAGLQEGGPITVDAHEKVARAFEAYMREGNAPTPELAGVFSRIRTWLVDLYRSIRDLDVELTDEVRGVFDRMLATDDQLRKSPLSPEARAQMDAAEMNLGLVEAHNNARKRAAECVLGAV